MTKDKPLIEEVVEWINPWGDKESAIPTRKVAEAVKKLKEDILFRKEFAQNEDEDIVLRDLLIDIDKIMGNFNHSPQDGFTREEEQPEISHPKEKLSMKNSRCEGNVANSTSEDTHVKKDKGCGDICECGHDWTKHKYFYKGNDGIPLAEECMVEGCSCKKFKPKVQNGCGEQINQMIFCGDKCLDGDVILCSKCEDKQ